MVGGNGRKPYTKIPHDLNLNGWAKTIRARREKLEPDVRQQLDDIGFPWGHGRHHGKSMSEQWDEKYNELVAFKEEHGHVKPPQTNSGALDNLRKWLKHQNERACNVPGTTPLSDDQRSRLVDVGVEFTVRVVVAGETVGMFAAETAGLAKSKAEDIYNGFDESIRNMSGEAMVYRILLELAKDGIVRSGDRIFRQTSGDAEVAIPTSLSPPPCCIRSGSLWEKTSAVITFKGNFLHAGVLLHPRKVDETKILARHEALFNDVHGVDSKGQMSKEDFYSLLKTKGLYHRCDFGLSEEMKRAVQKYITGAVSSGSDISTKESVIDAIFYHAPNGSDSPKVRKQVVRLINRFKETKLEKSCLVVDMA